MTKSKTKSFGSALESKAVSKIDSDKLTAHLLLVDSAGIFIYRNCSQTKSINSINALTYTGNSS